MQIIDVSSPRNPVIIGSADTPGLAWGVALSGTTVFVADLDKGLQIIDVSDFQNPVIIGSADTPGSAFGVAVSGTTAFVADGSSGLQIIDVSDFQNPVIIGSADTPGDAWGVALSGTSAFVADIENGLQIIDVSDPRNPVIIGSEDTPRDANGVAVSGTTAYVTAWGGGLQIIDVSDPRNPVITGSADTPGFAEEVAVSGTTAFVAVREGGLQIIDVSDPRNPVITGSADTPGSAFGVAVSGTTAFVADGSSGLQIIDLNDLGNSAVAGSADTPGLAFGVAVSGTTAFVADDYGLEIIDINDSRNPVIIGSADTPGEAFEVAVSGTTAYVADVYSGLQIIDVSDPRNPVITGSSDTPGLALGVAVSGTTAFVADYDSGLQIIDVSDPRNPVIIGSADTPGFAYGVAVSGTTAFVADYDKGLQIIDINDSQNPVIIGSADTPGFANEVAVSGMIAFVADQSGGLQIIDVSNLQNPVIIGSADIILDVANGVAASGTIVLVAGGRGNLHIIEVSDPRNPVIIGSLKIPGNAMRVAVSGTAAYVAAHESGLQILNLPSVIKIEPDDIKVNSPASITFNLPAPEVPDHYTLRVINEDESHDLPGAVTFVPPEKAYLLDTKAVIVAGGSTGSDNNIWKETKMATDRAYDVLLYQGYTAESIYYLSSDHSDTGIQRTDGKAAHANLSYALNEWAEQEPPAAELLVYLADHGSTEVFHIAPGERVAAEELDTWLDELQTDLPELRSVTVIYDACHSGTFLKPLTPPEGKVRTVLSSASAENAKYLGEGTLSFSYQFWEAVSKGKTVGEAFAYGKGQMGEWQTSLLDADGNGIANEDEDFALANAMQLRRGYRPETNAPYIYDVSDPQLIYAPETSATLTAKVTHSEDLSEIPRVWAIITPPDFDAGSPDAPVTDLPEIELKASGDGLYEAVYTDFKAKGEYQIKICAVSKKGEYSLFRDTSLTKSAKYITNAGTAEKVLTGRDTPARIHADVSAGNESAGIARVWAEISGSEAVTELYDPDRDGAYEGEFSAFGREGTYTVSIYAEDTDGFVCPPAVILFTWSEDSSLSPDGYEADNTFTAAKSIGIGTETQRRSFHFAGDTDWAKFIGMKDQTYTIRAGSSGGLCDPVVEICKAAGASPEKLGERNAAGPGIDEILEWTCPGEGKYYVKITDADPAVFGTDVTYNLTVDKFSKDAAETGTIRGTVTDISGIPLAGAEITVTGGGSDLSRYDGTYTVIHPEGTYTLRARAEGYKPVTVSVTVDAGGETVQDIVMQRAESTGDEGTPLEDALLILRLLTGESGYIRIPDQPDANGDSKTGLEEAIYLLQKAAGE